MSFTKKGTRASRAKPSIVQNSGGLNLTTAMGGARKMRSLHSLQGILSFALKRPRSKRTRGLRDSHCRRSVKPGNGELRASGNELQDEAILESELIQMPLWRHDDYYESSSPLSISSSPTASASFFDVYTTSSPAYSSMETPSSPRSARSSFTHVSGVSSPISSEGFVSPEEGFSSDEVLSLVSCSDVEIESNSLDFMRPTLQDNIAIRASSSVTATPEEIPTHRGAKAGRHISTYELAMAASEHDDSASVFQDKSGCTQSVEDDGEPYRIDLCDFEPDANTFDSSPRQRNNGSILCLRLDYEEVMAAWRDRGGGCLTARNPIYISPFLHPFQMFGSSSFVPHSPFF
ncbi:hypothetical protein KP509_24G060700 [Ceratopteris richardii]|uniref:Uncharacterized protein n=1 Tax=Ceratopteris richardii TaxID=49495 RepID=A0A8T2RV24_CERRI|nr:hypothetical protein KP509_24G060700 [Ceratopteris richardii]